MGNFKSKSIEQLEEKIKQAGNDPLRQEVLESAKYFKTSWIELGRCLYTVWKDKKFREWGFNEFENYTPTYEAVDVLRQAKSKKFLGEDDYNHLKSQIFGKGKDAREVKKDLTALIRSREELEPEEAWEKKREAALRRMLGVLKSLKEEAKNSKLVSAGIIKDAESLIRKLEEEL